MDKPLRLGLPWPWWRAKYFVNGDTAFFVAVSGRTLAFGMEWLQDGFAFFVGPCLIGWASISAAQERARKADALARDQHHKETNDD